MLVLCFFFQNKETLKMFRFWFTHREVWGGRTQTESPRELHFFNTANPQGMFVYIFSCTTKLHFLRSTKVKGPVKLEFKL